MAHGSKPVEPDLTTEGRSSLESLVRRRNVDEVLARRTRILPLYSGNGAMIAWAGLERLRAGLVDDLTAPARARWPFAAMPPAAA